MVSSPSNPAIRGGLMDTGGGVLSHQTIFFHFQNETKNSSLVDIFEYSIKRR